MEAEAEAAGGGGGGSELLHRWRRLLTHPRLRLHQRRLPPSLNEGCNHRPDPKQTACSQKHVLGFPRQRFCLRIGRPFLHSIRVAVKESAYRCVHYRGVDRLKFTIGHSEGGKRQSAAS